MGDSSPLAIFEWSTPKGGFRWMEVADAELRGRKGSRGPGPAVRRKRELALTAEVPWTEQEWKTRTIPLRDEPALFLRFADLDPIPDAVVEFANEHGWLGLGPEVDIGSGGYLLAPDVRTSDRLVAVETLEEWARAIHGVRQAVDLLRAAEAGDSETLAIWIRAEDQYATYRRTDPAVSIERLRAMKFEPSDFPEARPAALTFALEGRDSISARTSPLAEYVREGDLETVARFFAQRMINRGLDAHTRSACAFDPEAHTWRLHVVPRNLLGALWVQAADLVAGAHAYRRCDTCARWFAVSVQRPGERRSRADQIYCQNACKSRGYRQKRERAAELHRDGKAPSAVARELGTDTKTVRRWLGLPARKGRA